MQRVVVIGNSGSGKSTLAAELAGRFGVPHVEFDALYHQSGWMAPPRAVFRAAVEHALPAGGRWVADGNYSKVRDIVWPRADTLVWLDLPRPLVTARIVRRSVGRVLRGTELWNGNRERIPNLLSLDPQRSVIMWSIRQHGAYRRDYAPVPADPRWQHLRFVRLRSAAAARQWLQRLPTTLT